MPFPLNPTNGQQTTVNGLYYTYNSTIGAWVVSTQAQSISLTVTDIGASGTVTGTTGSFTNVSGALTTAAQPNITSVGTLTSLSVTGNVSGTTGSFTNVSYSGTITGGTGILNIGSGQIYKATNGNVGIGSTTTPVQFTLPGGYNIGWAEDATNSITNIFRQQNSASLILGSGVKFSNTVNGFASSYASAWARSAVVVGYNGVSFYTAPVATVAVGTDVTMNLCGTFNSTGDLLLGANASYFASAKVCLELPSTRNGYAAKAGDNDNYNFIGQNTAGSNTFYVTGAGAIVGASLSAGTITETSSRDLKTNFRKVENSLEKVLTLTAYIYDRKDGSEKNELGLIAEDVDPVISNLVMYDDNGNPVGIKYTRVGVLCLEAIKDMYKELLELKSQINK